MKKLLLLAVAFLSISCSDDIEDVDFKEEMRKFVIEIANYAHTVDNDFIIIPQNGQELITSTGEPDASVHHNYINAIDGVGREDLYFGYDNDNEPTNEQDTEYLTVFLDKCTANSIAVLVTDYCWTTASVDLSYQKNFAKGYIGFAAPSRELDQVPTYPTEPYNSNEEEVNSLSEAKNFLYLLNPSNFSSPSEMVNLVSQTNYDLIIIDLFFSDNLELTSEQVAALKTKHNQHSRLVVCYMSIGEAEDYRFYWDESWNTDEPEWLEAENPDWEGNYKVRYWNSYWKSIIYGSQDAYLDKILAKGFDGVYLDIIDAFEYFE
jgi:cysteinyl-tRNA synthetase